MPTASYIGNDEPANKPNTHKPQNSMTTTRIAFADWAKAVGIFLVVLAHTALWHPLQNWIYVFHMPLFFFMSGYLFSFKRHPTLGGFARSRFRRLMVPYAVFNALAYTAWLLVLRHVGSDGDDGTPWYSPLIGVLTGTGDEMIHDVPLWFFLCLYIVEVAYYALFRTQSAARRWLLILLFMALGWLNYRLNPVRLPFSLGTALVAMVFYAVAAEARRCGWFAGIAAAFRARHAPLRPIATALAITACLAVTLVVAHLNGRINMHINYYGNYALFFIGGFSGIAMLCLLFGILGRSSLIERISNRTLYICGLHLLVFAAMKGTMVYVLHVSPSVLEGTVAPNVLFALIAFIPFLFLPKKWMVV